MQSFRRVFALALFAGAAIILAAWALAVPSVIEATYAPIFAHGTPAGPLTVFAVLSSLGFLTYP